VGELAIPTKLATTAVAWEGDHGRAWLAELPKLVAEVAEAWDLDVGAPLEPGGHISWVAPARRRGDDLTAILKLQLPHRESDTEALGLHAWSGAGAVQLFDHDPHRHALLIERCRPGHALVDEGGTREAVEAGATVGALLHRATAPEGLDDLSARLAAWADDLDRTIDRSAWPDRFLVERALDTMRTRPAACREPAMLHGDLNPTNVLSAERGPWLAIDPKPMVGDPAYDGPRLVLQPDPGATDDPDRTLRERLDVVATTMELDRDALLEWCLVDTVEIGAFARARGDRETAERCEAQAVLLAPQLP
jgi:streptomycin 6-kinase